MKRLLILLIFIAVGFIANAQNIFLIKSDTLKGADTIDFTTNELTRTNKLIAIQVECYEIGESTSETTDTVYAITSLTNSLYGRITDQTCSIWSFPDPAIAITDSATTIVSIVGIPNNYFGFRACGVAGDTTLIKTYGITKR